MAEISVIIPVYNAEKYLNRCIESILRQSFSDFELILIDDGSTDGSGEICDRYGRQDHRITVIRQHNHGQAAAKTPDLMRFLSRIAASGSPSSTATIGCIRIILKRCVPR